MILDTQGLYLYSCTPGWYKYCLSVSCISTTDREIISSINQPSLQNPLLQALIIVPRFTEPSCFKESLDARKSLQAYTYLEQIAPEFQENLFFFFIIHIHFKIVLCQKDKINICTICTSGIQTHGTGLQVGVQVSLNLCRTVIFRGALHNRSASYIQRKLLPSRNFLWNEKWTIFKGATAIFLTKFNIFKTFSQTLAQLG